MGARRLQAIDRLLLCTLVPLWVVCLALSVRTILIGAQVSNTIVAGAETPEAYPSVIGFRPYADPERELAIGDRLIRIGDRDLRGASSAACEAFVSGHVRGPEPLPVVYERAGERRDGALTKGPFSILIWPVLPVSLSFGLVAALALLRARPSPMLRAGFLGMMSVAIFTASQFGGSPALAWASLALLSLGFCVTGPLVLRALQRFPLDAEPKSALARYGPWVFVLLGGLGPSTIYGIPFVLAPATAYAAGFAAVLVFALTALAVFTGIWRRADPVQRRQLKWFLFGVYAALLPIVAISALAAIDPSFSLAAWISLGAAAIIPIGLLIAVSRYDLFDVDRLLSATASYNAVIVLLLGAGFALVPRVAEAAAATLGLDPATGQVLLSVGLAAVIVPAQRLLRPQFERLFFAERHAIDVGIGELLRELSGGAAPRELTRIAGERLDALLRPEACAVYAREASAFVPIFARGRALPPAFAAECSLTAVLRERRAPLVAGRFAEHREVLGRFDRAALQALEAAVVLPIPRGSELFAFLCLGPKRSGDIYTPTDVKLLAMVAEKLSSELLRFEQAQVLREAREMQQSLRRYVPEAVAEQLAAGGELASGELEVTVLFVDIHGYTAFAEERRPADVFSTINRYTEAVSGIVRQHGGSVVEFNGDGMMAVFGAPRALPGKERAALAAGAAIASEVPRLGAGRASGAPALAVGVGIATGEAFVGSVRSADRFIWTAIGNTTNLAARLQALTRELGAAIVIDAATRDAAAPAAAAFVAHPETRIRGRREPLLVYSLPRGLAE